MKWNPFRDRRPLYGQDPHVTMVAGGLGILLIESVDEKRITISILDSLHSPLRLTNTLVWECPDEHQVWAPELHNIDGSWYIYYTASDGNNGTHRPYVLRSDHMFGPYEFCGRVGPDVWGIDMTQFQWEDNRYFVWSGWENNGDEFPQNLYIAVQDTPTSLGKRIRLSVPELEWETSIRPIMEGPQVWIRNNKLSILYSGNASWKQEYSTGLLTMVGINPLDPGDWEKRSEPLFPNAGHGCMVEDYFVYHRKISTFPGWSDRVIESLKIGEGL